MADERYEWLDREAAERLLRGEPVEAADEHARIQAARLSRELYGMGRPSHSGYLDGGEMPGEAAALAAFRKSRADADAPAGDMLGTVRLTPSTRSASTHRAPRTIFARPVRFGLVAAVAGCALGGVAVAAGTGFLGSPFGGDPQPASSVSAAATPGPLASESQTGGGTVAPPPIAGSPSTPPVSPPASNGGEQPDPSSGADGGSGKRQGDPDDKSPDQNAESYRKSVDACRDYRSGDIAPDRKRQLEEAAKGASRVERFCDRLLDGDTKGGGKSDGGGDSGGGDDGGDSGDDDGKGHGAPALESHSGGASLPPVSWAPLPAEPAPLPSESASLPSSGVALNAF
ncbi:hypothetical protein ACH492_37385 [Streptomyces sp. NPDC019443]|uniref:hypothetical protein n=1 Tax=Streptomyces sp. NPDC019443 TaxID=3365061 RepID=UPI0037AD4CBB